MGEKKASIHFFSSNHAVSINYFKKMFSKASPVLSVNEKIILDGIFRFAQNNIDKEVDESEKSRMQGELTALQLKSAIRSVTPEKATIVLRSGVISFYWNTKIRPENICKMVEEYCLQLYLPTLGVGLYDDTNFIICAKSPCSKLECGSYWFDEDDIKPVSAKNLCDILGTPQLITPFLKILSAQDGDEMAMLLESELGIETYLDHEQCSLKYETADELPGAVLYQSK